MIIATNNKNKVDEIKKILSDYEIYSLKDKNINIEIDEDGNTFMDNAKKKAIEIYNITKEEVIADDSGLCINCLNGYPGIKTNRFLGNVSDKERNEYLIKEVNKYDDRSAYVVCAICYYNGYDLITVEGVLNGFITKEIRGNNGFGFDPIFEVNGRTLAEITNEEKNKISARSIALLKLKEKLKDL